jgi:hypothetical protein
MKVEVSNGELVDKVSILRIKAERLPDSDKLQNVNRELEELSPSFLMIMDFNHPLYKELERINSNLWNIEDEIRQKERQKEFDQKFIELARQVYFVNDRRAEVKKKINLETGSSLVEEKSYAKYSD